MRHLYWISALLLMSCASLQGQSQPVKQMQSNLYFTTCSGMAETIGNCYDKAKTTCAGAYQIVNEFRDNSGVHRELTFSCKK